MSSPEQPTQQPPVVERPAGLKEAYPTKDGRLIHVTRIGVDHLRAHPTVIQHLNEAMAMVELPTDGSKLIVEVDLKRPLEKTSLLAAPDIGLDGEGWFAIRKGRLGASRITMEEPTEMVSTMVIIAWPPADAPGKYILRTAYIGRKSPMEPWSSFTNDADREVSLPFWTTHALVHDPHVMGEPFKSTWRTVLEEARKAIKAKAKTDAETKTKATTIGSAG